MRIWLNKLVYACVLASVTYSHKTAANIETSKALSTTGAVFGFDPFRDVQLTCRTPESGTRVNLAVTAGASGTETGF